MPSWDKLCRWAPCGLAEVRAALAEQPRVAADGFAAPVAEAAATTPVPAAAAAFPRAKTLLQNLQNWFNADDDAYDRPASEISNPDLGETTTPVCADSRGVVDRGCRRRRALILAALWTANVALVHTTVEK